MVKMFYKYFKILIYSLLFINFNSSISIATEAYFDLSDDQIEIKTTFNGKEVIIFGLIDPSIDTILVIKGPNKDTKISKKERIFGFWFHTKKITYRNLPSIFFVASTSPIKKILNDETIIKKGLLFEELLTNVITKRNFIDQKQLTTWNKNLIKIKKSANLYKEYELKIVDNKLFQSRIFFPNTTIPGSYDVNIYQIKNKVIINEKNKKIIIKKTGLGNKIYNFANDQPATYGILAIIFAVVAGLAAATAFRRL